jgi:hypothetical protein
LAKKHASIHRPGVYHMDSDGGRRRLPECQNNTYEDEVYKNASAGWFQLLNGNSRFGLRRLHVVSREPAGV